MRELLWKIKRIPYISIGLVIINVVIYMLNRVVKDRLFLLGNLNIYDVLGEGEYGRVIWAMFLHADLGHLFNNMIILLFMGAMLEREIGHAAFGSIYFLSGILGNVSSLIYKIMYAKMSLSIGASGAVFGMNGLLLALVLFSVRGMSSVSPARVVFMVILTLYNGFTSNNIDNAAHIGGLLAGFLMGCIVCIVQRIKYNKERTRYM